MTFTVTARHTADSAMDNKEDLQTDSQTPTANSLLLVFMGVQNHNSTNNFSHGVSGGGLSYTKRVTVGETTGITWGSDPAYRISSSMWTADVGASPSAFAATLDPWSDATLGYIQGICCDITGHGSSTPVQSATNSATVNPAIDTATGTVTLASTPAVGNLVIVGFFAGADTGGSFTAPTIGGQAMTVVTAQAGSGYAHAGLWYRVWTGAESNNVATCTDLGNTVGNWTANAVELVVASSTSMPVLLESGLIVMLESNVQTMIE